MSKISNNRLTHCAITSLPLIIGSIALCCMADGLSKPKKKENGNKILSPNSSCASLALI